MTKDTTRVLEEALRLPERERADLAAQLIDSLDPTSDENAEKLWSGEIEQRLRELDEGVVQAVPWPEARQMILEGPDEPAQP